MNLPKVYEPKEYESDIYALWEKLGAFTPQGTGQTYSIVAPPPNANADLHIGYALTMALEDIAIRYHRLKGDRTLFVPGADHAGFETWVVYEKKLAKEGKSRFDFTREQLYEQVWNFVAENRQNFETQFRRLGSSVDWPHFSFTLDEKIVKRAYTTFKKMWDEGLIYRGERLVNFCTFHGTSFADVEVQYKEEQGNLWYIRYPLTNGAGELVVATTRPETMLGDTGVAVHSEDARYHSFIGKTVKLPLTGREIPIVADSFVDPAFGTGVVKLTPAHDPNDYEAAQRHDLPFVSVIDHEGKMKDVPEAYRGLSVEEARKKVIEDLTAQGLLVKTEELTHSVGHCYKCDTVIQPLLREQWFIDMQPLAAPAIKALEAGEITFYPDAKRQQLITYLQGLKDWNISRQIAWGIPIPAFQNIDNPDDWIYDDHVHEELVKVDGKTYRRDPDVFDTWFSSSSWPYATLDFPDSQDFKDFYPLSLMETGGEILYPWVSRMIMLGLYLTQNIPFEAVYLHGYVMAEDGAKMSKSIGNVINPSEVIDHYGSDALRMGIIAGRAPAINRGYDERKVEDARNFCNKLWNVARYIEDKRGEKLKPAQHANPQTLVDHWILTKLQHSTEVIAQHLDNYRFSEAYETLYHFVWDDFADWYLEASKAQPNLDLLGFALDAMLKIAHPFAPFVTETIWQTLTSEPNSIVATSRWPEITAGNEEQGKAFEEIKAIVSEIRYLVATLGLKQTKLHYKAPQFITDNANLIERLTGVKTITEVQTGAGLRLTNTSYDCWLEVDPKILQQYGQKLIQKQKDQSDIVSRLEARLTSGAYTSKAPAEVIEQTKQQLAEAQALLATLKQEAQRFAAPAVVKPTAQQHRP